MIFDLRRMERVLDALGRPDDAFPAVHVAGTNGKGSVASLIAAALSAAGHRVGLYTSPHLERLTERFKIDGRDISERALARLSASVRRDLRRAALPRLTQFEYLTALAFRWFAASGVDVAVMEAGLGGRLDATNALRHRLVSVITNVGLDHTDWLGPTLRDIAREKAGIIRPRVPVVTGAEGEALDVIAAAARDRCSPLTVVRGVSASVPATALVGFHQRVNAAIAAAACDRLRTIGIPVPASAVARGFREVRWPGRLERFTTGAGENRITWLLDGAHNVPGARALERALRETGVRNAGFVFGALKDKDGAGIARALAPRAREVVTVRVPSERTDDPFRLARLAPWRNRARAAASLEAALSAAARRGRDTVVVTGSLYLVGAARTWLRRHGAQAALR